MTFLLNKPCYVPPFRRLVAARKICITTVQYHIILYLPTGGGTFTPNPYPEVRPMKISIAELRDLTTKAIAGFGYNEEETTVIREILLYAQLRGNNQGVVKLIGKGIPRDPAAGEIVIEKETP